MAGRSHAAAAEPLAPQPARFADALASTSRTVGFSPNGVLQHVQAAARVLADAVELVAHVVVDGPMTLDEHQLVEIQQRIAEGDLPAKPARLVEQLPPRVGVGHRRVGDRLLAAWPAAHRRRPASPPRRLSSGRPAARRSAARRCRPDRDPPAAPARRNETPAWRSRRPSNARRECIAGRSRSARWSPCSGRRAAGCRIAARRTGRRAPTTCAARRGGRPTADRRPSALAVDRASNSGCNGDFAPTSTAHCR